MMDKNKFIYITIITLTTVIINCCNLVSTNETTEKIDTDEFSSLFSKKFLEYFDTNNESEDLKNLRKILLEDQNPIELKGFPRKTEGRKCLLCYSMATTILDFYHSRSFQNEEYTKKFLSDLCIYGKVDLSYICRKEVANYFPFFKFILENRNLTTEDICDRTLQANYCFKKKAQYEELPIEKPILLGSKKCTSTSEKNLKILQLSDFHYDPHYTIGSSTNCGTYICCRGSQTSNRSEAAGKWGGIPCDSPARTIHSLLKDASKRFGDVDLIYVTGDFVDHFDWFLSREQCIESIQFVFDLIKEYFPNKPIYPVLGNHDTYPANLFAPNTIQNDQLSSKWLYKSVSNIWKNFLPKDALEMFENTGYYTVKIRPNLRLIALNSNVCFGGNIWLLYDNYFYRDQLKWLHELLLEASNNHERVHIISHVPSNDVYCYRSWTKELKKIIERFTHVISAQFVGHTHLDEFVVFYAKENSSNALHVAWNGGSATSFPNVYYNYKVYYIDDQTYDVTDSETWIFDLEVANKFPNESLQWYKSYSFKSLFKVPDMSPESIDELVKRMTEDDKVFEDYRRIRVKESAPALRSGCDADCKNFIIASIKRTEIDDTDL